MPERWDRARSLLCGLLRGAAGRGRLRGGRGRAALLRALLGALAGLLAGGPLPAGAQGLIYQQARVQKGPGVASSATLRWDYSAYNGAGGWVYNANLSNDGSTVGIGQSSPSTAKLGVTWLSTSLLGLVVNGPTGQSGLLQDWEVNGASLSSILSDGTFQGPHAAADGTRGATSIQGGMIFDGGLYVGGTLTVPAGLSNVYSMTTQPSGDTRSAVTTQGNFAATYTLPSGSMSAGDIYEIKGRGRYSSASGTAGTLTVKVILGSVTLVSSPAMTEAASVTNLGWHFDVLLTVRSTGSSGTVEVGGTFFMGQSGTTVSQVFEVANAAALTVNTTTGNALNIASQVNQSTFSTTLTQLLVTKIAAGPNSN